MRALADDTLSGYPRVENFPESWPLSSAGADHGFYYDPDANGCWIKPSFGWCSNPVLDNELGLCKDHLDQLREAD